MTQPDPPTIPITIRILSRAYSEEELSAFTYKDEPALLAMVSPNGFQEIRDTIGQDDLEPGDKFQVTFGQGPVTVDIFAWPVGGLPTAGIITHTIGAWEEFCGDNVIGECLRVVAVPKKERPK